MFPLLLSAAVVAEARGAVIITPQSAAVIQGNSSQIPLDSGGPERFHQVYDSSIFSSFTQGASISEIVFRIDENVGHAFATTVSDIEVHFSTTSQAVDSLSPVFDLNVGSDDKMVIGRGSRFLAGDPGRPHPIEPAAGQSSAVRCRGTDAGGTHAARGEHHHATVKMSSTRTLNPGNRVEAANSPVEKAPANS